MIENVVFDFGWIVACTGIIVLSGGAMLLLMLGMFRKTIDKIAIYIGMLFLLVCLLNLGFGSGEGVFFGGSLLIDDYVRFVQAVILVGAILALMLAAAYGGMNRLFLSTEFTVLVLFSIVGMLVMIAANDFMSLYIGLELQALCLYILASYDRDNLRSTEAGLKYFVLGALASCILLYGISLVYGFSGTINLEKFAAFYANYPADQTIPIAVLIGLVMVVIGFSFKIAAVPFHMWAPDVYQGAPLPVTAFFAIVPKIAAIAVLAKLLVYVGIWADSWVQIITFLAIASMLVGAFGAMMQKDLKRLLAYSAIGHVGYMLIGIAAQSEIGLQAMLLYAIVYGLLSAGIFALIMMIQKPGAENYDLKILAGLGKSNPLLAAAIAMIMLSMAGIPPFAGFITKFYIFIAAVKSELYLLTVSGLLISVISTYYYLRIVKIMYFDDTGKVTLPKQYSIENIVIASAVVVLNAFLFIIPAHFNDIIFSYVTSLMG